MGNLLGLVVVVVGLAAVGVDVVGDLLGLAVVGHSVMTRLPTATVFGTQWYPEYDIAGTCTAKLPLPLPGSCPFYASKEECCKDTYNSWGGTKTAECISGLAFTLTAVPTTSSPSRAPVTPSPTKTPTTSIPTTPSPSNLP
jgi:hypothetical protein